MKFSPQSDKEWQKMAGRIFLVIVVLILVLYVFVVNNV